MKRLRTLPVLLLSTACGATAAPAAEAPSTEKTPASQPAASAKAQSEAPASAADEEAASSADESAAAEGAMPAEPSSGETVPQDVERLRSTFEELARVLSTGTPDCDAADRFRQRVCDLAQRICDLSQQLPSSSRAAGDCTDGRERCRQANSRFDETCR
jgi:type VI protein secretion system component VasK